MATVTIPRADAEALFLELGVTAATKWNPKRMGAKLNKIDEMVDNDTNIENDKVDATLTTCLEAIENDDELVVGALPADADADADADETVPVQETAAAKKKRLAKEKKAADKKKADEKKAADKKATDEKDGKAKAKAAAKKKKEEEAAAAKKKKEEEATPGVRETRTRPYLAGVLIRERGLKAGVTKEMISKLNEMYGRENDHESSFTLRNAWHAIRGFAEEK